MSGVEGIYLFVLVYIKKMPIQVCTFWMIRKVINNPLATMFSLWFMVWHLHLHHICILDSTDIKSRCPLFYKHVFAFGVYLHWWGEKSWNWSPGENHLCPRNTFQPFCLNRFGFFSTFTLHHCHPSTWPFVLGMSGDRRTFALCIAPTIKCCSGTWRAMM